MWSTRAPPPSHTTPVTNILLELLILTRCMKAYSPPHKYSPRLQIILANSTQIYAEADLEGGVQGVRPPKIRKAYVIQR